MISLVYLFAFGIAFKGWLNSVIIVLVVLIAFLVFQQVHDAARRKIAAGSAGTSAAVLSQSWLALALTDRRLLVFAKRYWTTGFGPLLAAYQLGSIRSFEREAVRVFLNRCSLLKIGLNDGSILDLEVGRIETPDAFAAAMAARVSP